MTKNPWLCAATAGVTSVSLAALAALAAMTFAAWNTGDRQALVIPALAVAAILAGSLTVLGCLAKPQHAKIDPCTKASDNAP